MAVDLETEFMRHQKERWAQTGTDAEARCSNEQGMHYLSSRCELVVCDPVSLVKQRLREGEPAVCKAMKRAGRGSVWVKEYLNSCLWVHLVWKCKSSQERRNSRRHTFVSGHKAQEPRGDIKVQSKGSCYFAVARENSQKTVLRPLLLFFFKLFSTSFWLLKRSAVLMWLTHLAALIKM